MSIWEFINSFLYGIITGASLLLVSREPPEGHPGYSTVWHVGALIGGATCMAALLYLFYPYK